MKNIKLWIAICIIIFVSGIIGSIFILNKPHGTVVNILIPLKIKLLPLNLMAKKIQLKSQNIKSECLMQTAPTMFA
mgnify:CR=1 FL=1